MIKYIHWYPDYTCGSILDIVCCISIGLLLLLYSNTYFMAFVCLFPCSLLIIFSSKHNRSLKWYFFFDISQEYFVLIPLNFSLYQGIWVAAYVMNEVREDISWLEIASRFLLLVMVQFPDLVLLCWCVGIRIFLLIAYSFSLVIHQTSVLVLAFFSFSISQPLVSLMSLRKKDEKEYKTMSQALGISDSGILLQRESSSILDPNEPLDKLLLNRRFRQSFMEFADRYSFSFCENIIISLCCVHGSAYHIEERRWSCLTSLI